MVTPNTALPPTSYVPILKGKKAELTALESCASDRLVPLVEVSAPTSAAAGIRKAWPHDTDVAWIHSLNFDGQDDSDFAEAIEALFSDLRSDVAAVPVVTPTEEPVILEAVVRVQSTDKRGVVIRVEAEDILDSAMGTAADINSTLRALSLTPAEADLVLDCGLLGGGATVLTAVAAQCLSQLPTIAQWRSVVVAFSAFPTLIADVVPKQSVRAIPRVDASAFAALSRSFSGRPLTFGDYTVGTPTYGSARFAPIPNIRYASDGNWIIHRGYQRNDPSSQYRALANDIVNAPYYDGASFSPGDKQISDVAAQVSGPGNATTHLRSAISRHVHVVLARLATHGEP